MLEREAKIPPLANMYIRNVGFGGTKISNVTLQETKIAIDIPPTFFPTGHPSMLSMLDSSIPFLLSDLVMLPQKVVGIMESTLLQGL